MVMSSKQPPKQSAPGRSGLCFPVLYKPVKLLFVDIRHFIERSVIAGQAIPTEGITGFFWGGEQLATGLIDDDAGLKLVLSHKGNSARKIVSNLCRDNGRFRDLRCEDYVDVCSAAL